LGFICFMWSRGKVNGQWIIKLHWPDRKAVNEQ
jgi:hypothetical protein